MPEANFDRILSASLKSGVAILPLAIAVASMPAHAQPKTQAQLEQEAAAARQAAATGADADDAAAIAELTAGRTGTASTTENARDIVVVGTQIRGVAPTGTNLSVFNKEDIQSTGQSSVSQLLATIPGFSNFNSVPNIGGAGAQGGTAALRPNLRGTPDGDNGSIGLGDPGSATLILVDGNRQSGGGVRSSATDPESIPASLLERVEVNTDGASSSYGSDAIGGVVNFVTRRRFNGLEASGRLGYADNYWQWDVNALAGKDWGSGSAYISGAYAANSPLFIGDRAWAHPVDPASGRELSLNCDLPNISIASTAASGTGTAFIPPLPAHYYRVNADGSIARTGTAAPAGGLPLLPAAGQPSDSSTPNLCQPNLLNTFVNRNKRYSVMGNVFQKITDNIDVLARGNYSYVSTYGVVAPINATIPVGANNPWRQELLGTTGTQASYPTIQAGFPVSLNDVLRPCTGAGAVSGTNPVPCNGNGPVGTLQPVPQSVLTTTALAYGERFIYAHNRTKKFGGSMEANWRVDGNWLLKLTGVYDRTTTKVQYNVSNFTGINPLWGVFLETGAVCGAAISAYTSAGGNTQANAGNATALAARAVARQSCINPYNPEASNPVILESAKKIDSKSLAHNAIIDAKANLDGALFSIPGGKVRVAIGGEYLKEDFEKWQYQNGTPVPFTAVRDPLVVGGPPSLTDVGRNRGWDPGLFSGGSRWTWSVYGEINVPLVSRANELTWLKELRISASARYDKIKIFGSTFNPKIGASMKPTNWLTIRGNYNTSFRAPNVILSVAAESANILISPVTSNNITAVVPFPNSNQVFWIYNAGARKNLKPQTGNQWSVGIDLTPFRGFRASVSYGHIDYRNSLQSGAPAFTSRGSADALAAYGLPGLPGQGCQESNNVVVLDMRTAACTQAQIAAGLNPQIALTPAQVQLAKEAFAADALNGAEVLLDDRPVYGLYDTRFRNSGNSKIGAIDYQLRYNSSTSWGTIFMSASGSVAVIRKSQASDLVPYTGTGPFGAAGGSKHSMTAQAGFTMGPLRASATLRHSDGFRVPRTATLQIDRIGDFNVIDTFATWDFKGDNVIERGLQLSLSINNILNTSPPGPVTLGGQNGLQTRNGITIGRLVQVGFNKKF